MGRRRSVASRRKKSENGAYLLGAWVKDDVSGIGTVTFVDGTNFMALGHSVSDIDTGVMMRCSTGGVYTTDITNISKSYSSEPGRLQGSIAYRRSLVGIIDGNKCQWNIWTSGHQLLPGEIRRCGAYVYSQRS